MEFLKSPAYSPTFCFCEVREETTSTALSLFCCIALIMGERVPCQTPSVSTTFFHVPRRVNFFRCLPLPPTRFWFVPLFPEDAVSGVFLTSMTLSDVLYFWRFDSFCLLFLRCAPFWRHVPMPFSVAWLSFPRPPIVLFS